MRTIVSVVLATVLVTTPLKLVLAQAAEQEAATVQQTPDSSSHRLIGVPPVTDNTSRLWEPLASEDAFADIFAEDGPVLEPAPIPKGAKIAIYVVVVAIALVAVVAFVVALSNIQTVSPTN